MSAYVVSKTHIDLLVRAALTYDPQRPFCWRLEDESGEYAGCRSLDAAAESYGPEAMEARLLVSPSQLGQMLVDECVRSVAHRYPDTDPDVGDLPGPCDAYYMGPYVYEDPGYALTPGELFKAVGCYEYQSCEHPEWRRSEAFLFCDALRGSYETRVIGYDESPWGWDEADLRVRATDAKA